MRIKISSFTIMNKNQESNVKQKRKIYIFFFFEYSILFPQKKNTREIEIMS